MKYLDNLPVASIVFVAGLLVVLIGLITGDLSVNEAMEYIAQLGVGTGAIGVARSLGGKGAIGRKVK